MALTVNSKPSGFRAVGGGELIYQFTEASVSGKSNYRVEIELDGISAPIFEYRPNASLVIEADIAPILRSALELDFSTGSRFGNTFVKYQAKWDGGSDSQVSLSGDVIYYYCGVNHSLNKRTRFHIGSDGGNFLVPTEKLYVWRDRTAYLDFLHDGSMANPTSVRYYYQGANAALGTFDGTQIGMKSYSFTPVSDGVIQVYHAGGTYAEIFVKVLPECYNPIYLKWINDLGGISTWLFSFNQAWSLSPQVMWKDNIYRVETNVLTLDQWKMLQELNRDGLDYSTNRKSGSYVIDFTDEAYSINVYPVPEVAETMTKMRKHSFALDLRYEQIPNILL